MVALTNGTNTVNQKVTFTPFSDGDTVCNIFSPADDCQQVSGGINVTLNNGEQKIYVLQEMAPSVFLQ